MKDRLQHQRPKKEDKMMTEKLILQVISLMRIWRFILLFVSFWVLYGILEIVIGFTDQDNLNFQAIYLVVGMGILFFTARNEYVKAKNQEKNGDKDE